MKAQKYIELTLIPCGFCVVNNVVAHCLMPDLFGSRQGAFFAMEGVRQTLARYDGLTRLMVTVEGIGPVDVYTRSRVSIGRRIEFVTGFKALAVADYQEPLKADPESAGRAAAKKKSDEQTAYLRQVAAQEPPDHDCSFRREILNARKELGMEVEP